MTRRYSSTSVETTLATGISNTATTMTVASNTASALLGGVTLLSGNVDQFIVAIDPDTVNEELVAVTGVSSDTLTIVRSTLGTSAITHSGGAVVRHVLTANDLDYFRAGVDNALTASSTNTLTNKSIALSSNIISGTTAQFNTALTDGDFATLAGVETITNKTLTAPVISTISNSGTITIPTGTDTLVGRATTDTLTNKTISAASNTITGVVTPSSTDTLTNKTINAANNTLIGVASGSSPTLTGTVTITGDINLTAAGAVGSVNDEFTLILMGAL